MKELTIPYRITRTYIQKHPNIIFIYGQDVADKGTFGQSAHAHGEPNTFAVPTCWKMCRSSGYFSDSQYEDICKAIDEAIEKIKAASDGKYIVAFPKIGRGYSRMFEFAPKAYKYLMLKLDEVTSNYDINYAQC